MSFIVLFALSVSRQCVILMFFPPNYQRSGKYLEFRLHILQGWEQEQQQQQKQFLLPFQLFARYYPNSDKSSWGSSRYWYSKICIFCVSLEFQLCFHSLIFLCAGDTLWTKRNQKRACIHSTHVWAINYILNSNIYLYSFVCGCVCVCKYI